MTKLLVALTTFLLLLPCAYPAPRRPSAGEGLCFPTTVGAKWVYETKDGPYEEEVTDAKPDGKDATLVTVVRTVGGKETWRGTYRVSPDGLDVVASGGVTHPKPLPLLRARAKPGEEWDYTYALHGNAVHQRLKLAGSEPAEVAAGKFDARRLDVVTAVRPNGAAREALPLSSTEWYAPGVGLVKRVSPDEVVTLKTFTPGK
jgi:hypothetical protein